MLILNMWNKLLFKLFIRSYKYRKFFILLYKEVKHYQKWVFKDKIKLNISDNPTSSIYKVQNCYACIEPLIVYYWKRAHSVGNFKTSALDKNVHLFIITATQKAFAYRTR